MNLMQRRRALMGAQSESSNVLFEWDYSQGLTGLVYTTTTVPQVVANGVKLEGGSSAWSACSIAPDFQRPNESYRAVIDYINLETKKDGQGGGNSSVRFFNWAENNSNTKLYTQAGNTRTFYQDGTSSPIAVNWNPTTNGTMVVEYDKTTGTVTFIQGSNEQRIPVAPRTDSNNWLVSTQTGQNNTYFARVTLQHIKIERM